MIEHPASIRVAPCACVSGEEQKQGHTIDSQIAELRGFVDRDGLLVIDTYMDEAWSGAVLAGPALDRLRNDVGKKLFDAVLINDVDHLARHVTHLGVIKRDLDRWGIRVMFKKIPSESSPAHNLLVNILGSFAEFEREMILDRTPRGRRHKFETRQQFMGCIPPWYCDRWLLHFPRRFRRLSIPITTYYSALDELQRGRTRGLSENMGIYISRVDSHRRGTANRRRRDSLVLPAWSAQRSATTVGGR
jgi:hypothetical protein